MFFVWVLQPIFEDENEAYALEAFEAMSILRIRNMEHWRVAYVFNLCILSGFTLPEFFHFNQVRLFLTRILIRADLVRPLVNTDSALLPGFFPGYRC